MREKEEGEIYIMQWGKEEMKKEGGGAKIYIFNLIIKKSRESSFTTENSCPLSIYICQMIYN